jgi:signal transduction histidine kinase
MPVWLSLSFLFGLAIGAALAALFSRRILRLATLRERRALSRERFAELGAMTAGLAHEIKNPLSTIGLNTQLLAESIRDSEIDPDEKARLVRRTATVEREIDRLRSILTDFLEFAGGMHVDLRAQDINPIVDELVEFFMPQAEQAGVRVRSTLAPHPLIAQVDPVPFKQALLNLMINAVQAMKQTPGELLIRTERTLDADNQAHVAIHVMDTGPGIDTATRERIFQPYFTTKSGGSGLGLPMARRLIEAHQGRIDLHSELGRGSDFTIIIPASPSTRPL